MFQSLLFGLIASLTPCTIVLIPIFLYRFGMWGNNNGKVLYKDLALTLLGFVTSFLAIAFLFNLIFSSPYVNILRFVIGGVLILFGFLQLFGFYNFANSSKISNPFLLGVLLPWFIGFSPCVIPFFGITLTSGLTTGAIFFDVILFGVGLLAPSFLVAIIGDRFMSLLRKTTKTMATIEKYSGLLIVFAGLYLNFQIVDFQNFDLYIVAGFLLVSLSLGFYIIFVKHKLFNWANVLMFLSVVILSYSMFFNCKNAIYKNHVDDLMNGVGFKLDQNIENNGYACAGRSAPCKVCNRCATLFSASVIVGSLGFILSYHVGKKNRVK